MAQINGECDAQFLQVRTLLEDYIASGEELGASIAVNIDGRYVVDIWGGYADQERTRPWVQDTIVHLNSTTKAVTALAALMLVDRGLLDVNEKVAKYWPEFACNGKHDIEVRHVLSHTSGVSGWDNPVTMEDLCRFDECAAKLAQQSPWWAPGSASGYHSWTYGFLVGQLVRRTTGKTLKQFIADEIASVCDSDFQLGAVETDWPRISNLVPPTASSNNSMPEPGSIAVRTFTNPPFDLGFITTSQWRRAELGSANGHGNARSVADILSAISLGKTIGGKRILSKKTIDLIFQEQSRGLDHVAGSDFCFGIGYALPGKGNSLDWIPGGRVCTWGGFGGSIVIMDLDCKLSISYAMNKLDNVGVGSDRTKAYVKSIYTALGIVHYVQE